MNEDNARPWTSRGCPCISPRCQDSGHLAPSVRRSPSWALGTGHLVSTPAGKRTAAGQETHAHVVKEAPGYGPDTRTWQSARRGEGRGTPARRTAGEELRVKEPFSGLPADR